MGETFYTALGVDPDADTETIQRAYREQVKNHHPDVSDDDDATERFKRLTAARDVLTDASRRSRYDRIGHAAYVRRHLDSTAWSTEADTTGRGDSRRDGSARSARRESATGRERSARRSGERRSSRSERDGSSSGPTGSRRRGGERSTSNGAEGGGSDSRGGANESETASDYERYRARDATGHGRRSGGRFNGKDGSRWTNEGDWTASDDAGRDASTAGTDDHDSRDRAQAGGWRTARTAANSYSPSGRDPGTSVGTSTSTVERFRSALGEIGPWIAFHFAFLVSAFVTVWLLVTRTPSVTTVFLSLILLSCAVFFSVLHMMSRVYS